MAFRFYVTGLLFILFSEAYSQQWIISHVDRNGSGSVEIRVDANDQEIHVLCKGNFDDLTYYFSPDHGKTWQKKLLGEITHRTFEVGEIASLIDHAGVYHVAYFSERNDIIHAFKTGDVWKNDTILHNKSGYSDAWHRIFLDVDSSNMLHAFFKDQGTRKYFVKQQSGWQMKDAKFTGTSFDEFTFDLDNSGIPHVVSNNYNGELVHHYSTNQGVTWKYELVGNFNADGKMAMKTDSKGNPHIVFVQDESRFRGKTEVEICTYVRKTAAGTWEKIVIEKQIRLESQINESSTFYNHYPAIDVDSKDGIHIAYLPGENNDLDYPVGDSIVYAYLKAGEAKVTYRGVPCQSEFYPGVCIRVMNNNIYYGYIGSSDGVTNNRGIELAMMPFLTSTDSTNVDQSRETKIQAEVSIQNPNLILDIWDSGEEDGDILTILIDGVVYQEGIKLLNAHQQIPMVLESGKTYVISVVAVSEGLYPPCTAVVIVKDGVTENAVTITSDGQTNGSIKLIVN